MKSGIGTPRATRLLPVALLIATLAIPSFPTNAVAIQLKAIGRFGFDGVGSMVYSPMGNLIAVRAARGEVQVVDARTGRPVVMLPGLAFGPVFTPDERTLITAGSVTDDYISIWDVQSGREMGRLDGRGSSLAMSPDGSFVAGVVSGRDEDGNPFPGSGLDIALWSLATGDKVAVLGTHRYVNSLAFSPDGRILASGGGGDDTIKLWDVGGQQEITTLTGHTDTVRSLAFSPDGAILASGSYDGTAKLWDVGSGLEIATLTGHTDGVNAVAFSRGGETLASGSSDRTVKLWDVGSARETVTLTAGQEGGVVMVAFTPDGVSLVSGSSQSPTIDASEDMVRVWDIASRQQVDSFGPPYFDVSRLAFSPDGKILASSGGASSAEIALWDVASGRRLDILTAGGRQFYHLTFSPDGTVLAAGAGGSDGVTLWDVASWQPIAFLEGSAPPTFTPDGTLLATGSGDAITLWDFPSLQQVATLLGHSDGTFPMAFSPDGSILAAGGRSRDRIPNSAVWLWDVGVVIDAARALGPDVPLFPNIARWPGNDDDILDLEFSPDGRLLARGDRAAATRLWDVATGAEVASLSAPDRSRGIAFSPGGRTLASTGNGGNGTLWDVASREEIATFTGSGRSFPSALAYSPDGTLLATGDRGVFLWGVTDSPVDVPTAVEPRGKVRATWAQVKHAARTPTETAFLPNFPNPFNPETWIPFDLHDDAQVTISIRGADGSIVRSLDLGEHPAGTYRTRDHAAHWDGRNQHGEIVSSGVYFAELRAGDFRSTRRIAVRK